MIKDFIPCCEKCLFCAEAVRGLSIGNVSHSLCKHQRSSDSSTSDFASPSPEPEDMEFKFPASSQWDPNTRPFAKLFHRNLNQ